MEKIKLKPCPFCGEKPKLYDVPEHGYQIALCECSCGSAFAGGKTTEEAAKNWNRLWLNNNGRKRTILFQPDAG